MRRGSWLKIYLGFENCILEFMDGLCITFAWPLSFFTNSLYNNSRSKENFLQRCLSCKKLLQNFFSRSRDAKKFYL